MSGTVYKGNWKNDGRDGFGTCKYADGSVYVGNWIEDTKDGIGTYENG